ncbi:helix-turn-helix domain-containing protein [Nocardia noduli]|uniref:helix-turn-helix domain-containing protein n=1 Tax=Nocardia noduli TaxID=2815722 RepID=UPI001C23DAE0|nr:helix-turn-helix domain-containing protein [Nocardia noduli]
MVSDSARESLGTSPSSGRGVLDAGFQVLQAISECPDGCGLSVLSRSTGIPKATAYRLAEQLVGLGAVQRVEQRYFVGSRLAELGRQWQVAPMLRRAAQRPGRVLAALTESMVAVCVLDQGAVHMVTGFNGADVFLSAGPGSDLAFRTALAQVLMTARADPAPPPPGYTGAEWHRVRTAIEDNGSVAVDHFDVANGLCCAAATIRWNGGVDVAAIGCMSLTNRFPPGLPRLVAHAAREIEKNLR